MSAVDASALDISEGKAAVERLLGELGLRDFVYTLEPKEGGWQLHLECSTAEGWQTVALPADIVLLRASLGDAALRERLREDWRERLAACRKSAAGA
jgi:hypothetical protein